ncbi:hypothetical protein [Pacificoceanicola onchidii]|uniref:hypothetical protein n=1 Tax=Pacificoceanicola onchidii TaxID=2562685 RepID=UPI0010A348F9|nr:hypothetical protein [Pacificoceanicola onchidii]
MTCDHSDRRMAGFDSTENIRAEGKLDVSHDRLPGGARFVRFRPVGFLSKDAVLETLRLLSERSELGAKMPTLWDFRGFDFNPYDLAVCRRQLLSLAHMPQRKGALRAFVVDSELGYGCIRMAQEVLSGHGIEDMGNLHVTYSCEDALQWIAEKLLAQE